MNQTKKNSRALGAAFLLQFITSLISGAFLLEPLLASDSIIETMTNIANHPTQLRLVILLDMITALGIIFLGVMLFITLRKQNEKIALVALGFYILEAALLATSRIATISLLQISQESVITGHPDYLQVIGTTTLESMSFVGGTLHMLVFCLGAILFYYLLDKARIVPRFLSLWGLITVFPCLIATLLNLFGYEVPFLVYVPYVPFEFVVGAWILVKGFSDAPDIEQQLAPA